MVLESTGTVHGRGRTGFRIHELAELDRELERQDVRIDHAVCILDGATRSTWEVVLSFGSLQFDRIGGLDLLVPLTPHDRSNHVPVAEAIFAAATLANVRLFLDPLQRLDREASLTGGLLDRLSNPEPTFHVVRLLASMLFDGARAGGWAVVEGAVAEAGIRAVRDGWTEHWLVEDERVSEAARLLAERDGGAGIKWTDLVAGESVVDVSTEDVPALTASQLGNVSMLTFRSSGGVARG
jgi:hypothetical protein